MEKSKMKPISISVLILTLIILFSSITYARPITDIFGNGLLQINNFFVQEQYRTYATAIDFFFFALLFIAIYMMGARYAFKEVKRPEQVIVILLGLMTAFLLVMGGFSATILLPYIHWLLYLLLFISLWHLLKGIKNKFWRFLLALLLTLLIIGFFAWLFNMVTPPETGTPQLGGIEDFFKSFADSFKGVDFGGYVPGLPSYVRDALQLPSVPAPTPAETTATSPVTAPTPIQPKEKGGIFGSGYSWWWLLLLLLLVFVFKPPRDLVKGLFGKKKPGEESIPTEELTIQKIIDKIEDIIKRKKDSIKEIDKAEEEKTAIIQAQDKRIAVLAALKDPAYLWEGIRDLEEGHPLKEFRDKEIQLITELKKLKDIEKEFLEDTLPKWLSFLSNKPINITYQEVDYLKNLIGLKTTIQQVKDMGIIWLITLCYDIEKREFILNKGLKQLLDKDKIEEIVKGKFETVKADERKLSLYNAYEIKIIKLLEEKIKLQIEKLEELKRKISGVPPSPYAPPYGQPYGAPPYGVPYAPPYGTPYYGVAPTKTSKISQTLKNNPNAILNHYDEIGAYFKSLPSSYMGQVMNLTSQINQSMSNSVRSVICIPVAGHQEGSYIYESLKNYTYQTANSRLYEIVLFVNYPDKDPEGKQVTPDNTLNEIERFISDCPNTPLRIVQAVIPLEQAKIGYIRKLLTDAVLLHHHNRGRNIPDLIIVSNDADNKGIAPQYIDNFIRKFDENPRLDALIGEVDWDIEDYIKYPLIHLGARLFQSYIIIQKAKGGIFVSTGSNFAFKSSIYASVGGYDAGRDIVEDVVFGNSIVQARGTNKTIGFAGSTPSRIFTSARRAVYALKKGYTHAEQWNLGFSAFDDEVRMLETNRVLHVDYNDPKTIKELSQGIEWVVNRTLDLLVGIKNLNKYQEFKKILGLIGIKYKIDNGRIKITNLDSLIQQLKNYQSRGLSIRDLKSGKRKIKTERKLMDIEELRPKVEELSESEKRSMGIGGLRRSGNPPA